MSETPPSLPLGEQDNSSLAPTQLAGNARDILFDAIRLAFCEGCDAVQNSYQEDAEPDFGEASDDYAHSVIDSLSIDLLAPHQPRPPFAETMAVDAAKAGWWTYTINYGPEGEENYANVYTPGGEFVGNLRIYHARAIVGGLNVAALPPTGPDGGAGAQLRPRSELLTMLDKLVSRFMAEDDVRAHELVSAVSEAAERIRADSTGASE